MKLENKMEEGAMGMGAGMGEGRRRRIGTGHSVQEGKKATKPR